ncbi:MAG: hypothetical protein M9913_16015 [Bryobacteraceae bacterium]|nr:hypothetical protein [Solibacteraceae bacterium]MCL4844630.1 hypothetical protein [Bryobacteraceae bacterium]MCO5352382.1 hypothetical protein [Bryobacteraceae bacterium]
MPRHTKHSPTDLNDAIEHVVYEMWKYKQSVSYYGEILQAGGDAAIEFRVLHHRVLLEFFYGPARHQDNIVAWEFIDDWQSTYDRSGLPWLDDYMTRCHTMLAHISKTRTDLNKRGLKAWNSEWQVVEPHLDQTISEFLGGLSANHKRTCLYWMQLWLKGSHPGRDALRGLVPLVKVP